MGRPLRRPAGGVVYHVLNRWVMRLPLSDDAGDYLAFGAGTASAADVEDDGGTGREGDGGDGRVTGARGAAAVFGGEGGETHGGVGG